MATILALDLGERRVGVARANDIARLAEPLKTLPNDGHLTDHLQALILEHGVNTLVIGLPRNLKGQTTAQTTAIQQMAARLQQALGLTVHWQDETLTSQQAEQELKERGVRYNKATVDALAACLILDDFLRSLPQSTHGEV
jgi:putative Holliday junction resolvase